MFVYLTLCVYVYMYVFTSAIDVMVEECVCANMGWVYNDVLQLSS